MDLNKRSDLSSSEIANILFAAEIDCMPPLFPLILMNLKNHLPLHHHKQLMRLCAKPFPCDVNNRLASLFYLRAYEDMLLQLRLIHPVLDASWEPEQAFSDDGDTHAFPQGTTTQNKLDVHLVAR